MKRLPGKTDFIRETYQISGNLVDLSMYTNHFSGSIIFFDLFLLKNSEILRVHPLIKVKCLKFIHLFLRNIQKKKSNVPYFT